MRISRRLLECAYVAAAGALPIIGAARHFAGWYFAALALTLPVGLAAFIGIYVAYGLIKSIAGLMVSTTASTGEDAAWLAATSAVVPVVLFVAAAGLNVLLLERTLLPGRQDSRQDMRGDMCG